VTDDAANLRTFLEDWGRDPWTPEAWEAADLIDMSFLDPEVVYEDTTLPDHIGEEYRGPEGIRRAARRWVEPNEWIRVELIEILAVGDRLVSVHHLRSKARHSGIEFDTRDPDLPSLAYIWTFRDGKVIHFKSFLGQDKALAEAREIAGQ
jgi:ketosteroid isomerase-like protein